MKGDKNGKGDAVGKTGYRPLNEGYSAIDKRGYTGKDKAGAAQKGQPKPPVGGTGKTAAATIGAKDSRLTSEK